MAVANGVPEGISGLGTSYRIINGDVAGERFGATVNAGGDFNGDGYADAAVAAPGGGRVYLLFGGGGGLFGANSFPGVAATVVSDVILDVSGAGGNEAHISLAFTDFDNDGYDDVIIGQPEGRGRLLVVYGKGDWGAGGSKIVDVSALEDSEFLELRGESGSEFGFAIAGGYNTYEEAFFVDDVLVGAPGEDKVYNIQGAQDRPASHQGLQTLDSMMKTTFIGQSGSRLGDSVVLGPSLYSAVDSRGSLGMGAPYGQNPDDLSLACGRAYFFTYLYYNEGVNVDVEVDQASRIIFDVECSEGPSLLGSSMLIDKLGIEDDQYSDVLLSGPLMTDSADALNSGWVYYLLGEQGGPFDGILSTNTTFVPALVGLPNEELGFQLASADVDGDGIGDPIFGTTGKIGVNDVDWGGSDGGQVYLFLSGKGGFPSGTSNTYDLQSVGAVLRGSYFPDEPADFNEEAGSSLSGAGNVFGSLYEPFLVGAPLNSVLATSGGRVYFVVPNDDLDQDGDGKTPRSGDCDESESSINTSIKEICDDGIDQDCSGADLSCAEVDQDKDSYTPAEGDCDDTDPAVYPGKSEACNEVDDDCDELIDEGVQSLFYFDGDGDGYANLDLEPVSACSPPDGYIGVGSIDNALHDCDDGNANTYPSAEEVCNVTDDDCDGSFDEGAQTEFFHDADDDGYGDPEDSYFGCSAKNQYIEDVGDCNDDDATINPETIWYADQDGDGFGGSDGDILILCAPPEGFTQVGMDCNDLNANTFPDAEELCDGEDNNCDDAFLEAELIDEDGDGYLLCQEDICADGVVSEPDLDASVNPGMGEICLDGKDNDCDATIDEGEEQTYYLDSDLDGYGDSTLSISACGQPNGYSENAEDCDDDVGSIYPGATEICDDEDQDCDEDIDEGLLVDEYLDGDGDGYGDPEQFFEDVCPSEDDSHSSLAGDCDDGDATIFPGAEEVCGERDEDCDGNIDEGLASYYVDSDGDGFGDDGSFTCGQPGAGTADTGGDCDDSSAEINPNAEESCNGFDDDCDLEIDEGLFFTYYLDQDGDGYGDPSGLVDACEKAEGYAENALDCDDGNSTRNPEAVEVCGDGIDENCNGQEDEDCLPVDEGCGCSSGSGGGSASLSWLLLLAFLRASLRREKVV